MNYCGEDTCHLTPEGNTRLVKKESIMREMFLLFESLSQDYAAVKIGYMEFTDKAIEPFGQPGTDYCYKFLNSLVPYDKAYREWIEDHWSRTWTSSPSGRDFIDNQLDAAITAALRAD